jgi:hypothetical protein
MGDHLDVLGHYPAPVRAPARSFWSKWFGRDRDPADIDRPGSPAWEGRRREELAAEAVVEHASRAGGTAPRADADARHVDWLSSGAGFDDDAFASLMNAVARGMLGAGTGR